MNEQLLVVPTALERHLTAARFKGLADVPAELGWLADLGNASTRRAYENALQDFMRFTGIARPEEFRIVTRAHVIAWRDDVVRRALSGLTVRHSLAAFSSLFESLCEKNAVNRPAMNTLRYVGAICYTSKVNRMKRQPKEIR